MRREELVDQRPSRVDGVTRGERLEPKVPRPDRDWHPDAKRLFQSVSKSGQAVFFQQTDWEVARAACGEYSRYLRRNELHEERQRVADAWWDEAGHLSVAERAERGFARSAPQVPRGGSVMALELVFRTLGQLGFTEGERRRMRIELESPEVEAEDAVVVQLQAYQDALARGAKQLAAEGM